jgi:hypothetical protein
MRIAESQLRRIVREQILAEDERRRAEMMADVERELDIPEIDFHQSDWGLSFRSYNDRRTRGRTVGERRLKALWNKHADHGFFKEKLAKLHIIGLYGHDGGTCLDYLDVHAGKTNRDELSAFGWRESQLRPGWNGSYNFAYGVFVDGRVTYAASTDQGTEWTSMAKKDDRQRHASSGLPKRPLYMSNQKTSDALVLDEEDWVDRIEQPDRNHNHELVIANWRIKSFVANSMSYYGAILKDGRWTESDFTIELVKSCRQKGLPIVDEAGEEYHLELPDEGDEEEAPDPGASR